MSAKSLETSGPRETAADASVSQPGVIGLGVGEAVVQPGAAIGLVLETIGACAVVGYKWALDKFRDQRTSGGEITDC